MGLSKTYTFPKKSSSKNDSKNSVSEAIVIYKTKTSGSSFPKKVAKLNKLLSKAKLMK